MERAAAARALRSATLTPGLRRALRESLETTTDPAAIGAIAATIAWHHDRGATATLAAAFRSTAPQAAASIARALGALGTPVGLRALVEGLDVPETADAARVGLVRAGPAALPALRRVLEDAPTLGAITVATEIGDSSLVPALVAIAGSDSVPMQVAALEALRAIGDERAAPSMRELLGDPDPAVVDAAVAALGVLGSPADADVLVRLLEGSEVPRERAVLAALVRIAPAHGRDAIVARITSDDPAAVRRATEVALAHPSPELAAVYHGLFQHDVRRTEAASVLAELEDAAGLPAMEAEVDRLAELSTQAREDLSRALAVALRRWRSRLSDDSVEAYLADLREALGTGVDDVRGLALRSLAGDPSVAAPLERALASEDVATRTWAAQAVALLPSLGELRELLIRRLETEDDVGVLRALLHATWAHRIALPGPLSTGLMSRPELGPAPLLVLRGEQPDERRRALRRALRQGESGTRVAAALALAGTGDRAAWRALVARLDEDPDPIVRRAAAGALAALGVEQARDQLRRRARIEADGEVRRALEDAAAGRRRPLPRGWGVLRFAVRAAGAPRGVWVRIALPGGAIWQLRTLPTGEVFVPAQPAGAADVRVLLDEAGP